MYNSYKSWFFRGSLLGYEQIVVFCVCLFVLFLGFFFVRVGEWEADASQENERVRVCVRAISCLADKCLFADIRGTWFLPAVWNCLSYYSSWMAENSRIIVRLGLHYFFDPWNNISLCYLFTFQHAEPTPASQSIMSLWALFYQSYLSAFVLYCFFKVENVKSKVKGLRLILRVVI